MVVLIECDVSPSVLARIARSRRFAWACILDRRKEQTRSPEKDDSSDQGSHGITLSPSTLHHWIPSIPLSPSCPSNFCTTLHSHPLFFFSFFPPVPPQHLSLLHMHIVHSSTAKLRTQSGASAQHVYWLARVTHHDGWRSATMSALHPSSRPFVCISANAVCACT